MTSDQKLADFRRWALAVLDLLSAESDRQVAYLRASGVEADEILLQFDDVLHVARARMSDGSLSRDDYLLLQSVDDRVHSVNAKPSSIWGADMLEGATVWRELRVAAKAVKLKPRKVLGSVYCRLKTEVHVLLPHWLPLW